MRPVATGSPAAAITMGNQRGDDHVDVEANEFAGLLQKGLAAFGRAHFQPDVLALDQASRPQRAAEPLQERGIGIAADEDANSRCWPA